MQRNLDNWNTPLVPPLGEATVTDWIRHHMARVALPAHLAQQGLPRDTTMCTSATPEELDAAVRGAKRDAFWGARSSLDTYAAVLVDSEDEARFCERIRLFEVAREARLRMGHLRYETCGANIEHDSILSCRARLAEYEQTGNQECLVDIANLCELEYWHPRRERTAWNPRCAAVRAPRFSPLQSMRVYFETYSGRGCLTCLAHAVNLVEAEFILPTHPSAHWEAQDTGGHPSLREAAE